MKVARHTIVRGMASLLLAYGVLTLFSTYASATPIVLNNGGTPQPANAGDGTIQAWLTQVITDYNTAHGTDTRRLARTR